MPAQSKAQRRLFGWARGVQKGTATTAPASVTRLAESMKPATLNHFAKTPEKKLPEHVKTAYARGFIKAACLTGMSAGQLVNLVKQASSGMLPAVMGAIPGALAGGYIGHDRAQERKQEDPNYTGSPTHAALLGAGLGAGVGGLAGAGIGSVGWERGIQDESQHNEALMRMLTNQYMGA